MAAVAIIACSAVVIALIALIHVRDLAEDLEEWKEKSGVRSQQSE